MKNFIFLTIFALCFNTAYAQKNINIIVNASAPSRVMPPIWRDHYECHMVDGYGPPSTICGQRPLYITDPAFASVMAELKPRFIRISIGRMDNPPDTCYFSKNTDILRNLKYEFYRGGNSIKDADNPANYKFSYIDFAITVIKSIGAEPFITMDYMPFTLSRDTTPDYPLPPELLILFPYLGYDNSIRNSPPRDNAVYGRVMYHFIKHCYQTHGVRYFEHWNEPDQEGLLGKFFWKGDDVELYKAYAAIADEVSADTTLANNIKLGGCSFVSFSSSMSTKFLNAIRDNNKKFDFLSFHPYSDTQYKGGYDAEKVKQAINWRNTYVPNAELINAEWGRLDLNSTVWGDLDYGLDKFRHIIDMLNRGVTMSHPVGMFDIGESSSNFTNMGLFRVGPIVPKPTAYVFYNLNKMNDALNRLPLSINEGMYALAGKSDANDKIVIIFPADEPTSGMNVVNMHVVNLPWGSGGYYIYRYELTEQSYLNGIIYNLTYSNFGTGSTASDSFKYPSTNNSGRLIVWEISANPLTNVNSPNIDHGNFTVFPNPNGGSFFIESKDQDLQIQDIQIINSFGQVVSDIKYSVLSSKVNLEVYLNDGLYFAILNTNKGVFALKFIVHK